MALNSSSLSNHPMKMARGKTIFLFVLSLCYSTRAFASFGPASWSRIDGDGIRKHQIPSKLRPYSTECSPLFVIRGGEQAAEVDTTEQAVNVAELDDLTLGEEQNMAATDGHGDFDVDTGEDAPAPATETAPSAGGPLPLATAMAPITSILSKAGSVYSASLAARPIMTKSFTACLIFGLSDWSAQHIESSKTDKSTDKKETKKNWTRIIVAALVGLLYFGPAAHSWYDMIFKILPGTSLVSTLQKATLGQLIFGPSFTCVFFATSLMQAREFSLGNWFSKIRNDLPGAWVAGLSFWPLVDLVSYSLVPVHLIPLFVNACSFVWTIYLSMLANQVAVTK